MSSHDTHGDHEHDGHDGHDDHAAHAHDHDFDPEPTRVVPDDEPRTPAWVPALGASLFTLGIVAFLAMGDAKGAAAPAASGSASAARPASSAITALPRPLGQPPGAPPGVQRAPGPGRQPTVMPVPHPSGTGGLQRLSPEDAKALQERMEQARKARGAPAPTGQP